MFQFLPWKFFIKRAARHYGVMDPEMLMARMRRFAQPSEVAEPLELLRAGIVFHARGLVNAKAIQHNLDWVWPYWVEQQFNLDRKRLSAKHPPETAGLLPAGFSAEHLGPNDYYYWDDYPPQLYPAADTRIMKTAEFLMETCFHKGGSGLLPEWLESGEELFFGPTLTRWGEVCVRLKENALVIEGEWRGEPPKIKISLNGYSASEINPFVYRIKKDSS